MATKQYVFLGFIVTLCICATTMSAAYPKLYSPYSFTVVIPAFSLYYLPLPEPLFKTFAALPTASLFLISAIPQIKGRTKVGKVFTCFAGFAVFLSIIFLANAYSYGVKYQGVQHTLFMYAYNAVFIALFLATYYFNLLHPKVNSALLTKAIFFIWFGWCSFPWLGELM